MQGYQATGSGHWGKEGFLWNSGRNIKMGHISVDHILSGRQKCRWASVNIKYEILKSQGKLVTKLRRCVERQEFLTQADPVWKSKEGAWSQGSPMWPHMARFHQTLPPRTQNSEMHSCYLSSNILRNATLTLPYINNKNLFLNHGTCIHLWK